MKKPEKPVNVRSLAKEAGVSVATISRALRQPETVAAHTREKILRLVPDYMVMGERGMADMGAMEMPLPDNTLPMMTGTGPFGAMEKNIVEGVY